MYVSNPIDDQGFCSTNAKMLLFRSFLQGVGPLLKSDSFVLFVRLHPRENKAEFQTVVTESGFSNKIRFVQEFPLFACLKSVELSVVLASTVGLESMLCGTPVAVLPLPSYGYVHDYVSSGCALGLSTDPQEMRYQLERMLNQDLDYWRSKCQTYVANQLVNIGISESVISKRVAELLNG
jgi:hypothetical protein